MDGSRKTLTGAPPVDITAATFLDVAVFEVLVYNSLARRRYLLGSPLFVQQVRTV
jgi:hypothetical protein